LASTATIFAAFCWIWPWIPISEIITAVNVLPGNGAEAADAIHLIPPGRSSAAERRGGKLSMDGAGYNGPVLRALTDPAGLNIDVTSAGADGRRSARLLAQNALP